VLLCFPGCIKVNSSAVLLSPQLRVLCEVSRSSVAARAKAHHAVNT
jgi:hypothetical protein